MAIEVEKSEGAIPPEAVSSKEVETRSILQATYTPRKPKPEENLPGLSRGLEKGAFLSYLAPSREELDELTKRYKREIKKAGVDKTVKEKHVKTVEIISAAISKQGQINVLRGAKQFAQLEVANLCRVSQDLVRIREAVLDTISEAHKTIIKEYTKALPPQKDAPLTPEATVKDLMDWAIKNNVETQSAHKTIELAKSLSLNLEKIALNNFTSLATRRIDLLRNRIDACEESLATEHIGYLHLERMGFTPAGIERGRLVYSVPLSPGEEVNIKHREWSRTSEEFESIVTDYMEEFSEEGVTEKTELAQSVNSQKQHSNAFNTAVSTSGEAWGFSITASVGYNASESASKSEQITRNHTRELTSKASSRSKQEHKISFRVASARETEDETVQRIKNPFPDRATRVDYYQLMRKWQVDLYRYGIRLTYDIAIPEPGSGLMSKLVEINDIHDALEMDFQNWTKTVLEGKALEVRDITPETYADYAEKFNAVIDGEPPLVPTTDPDDGERTKILLFNKPFILPEEESELQEYYAETFEIEIPEEYVVLDTYWIVRYFISLVPSTIRLYPVGLETVPIYEKDTSDYYFGHYDGWNGKTGKLPVLIYFQRILNLLEFEFKITVTTRDEVYRNWQLKTFNTIQEAAQLRYYENRQRLEKKLARLLEEIGSQDALSLRKKEREEVMKGVLRFLVCPDIFEGFFPESIEVPVDKDIEEVLYELETSGLVVDEGVREALLEHGEKIKFLHHAIEWENMLYFLYPYFWTHPNRWEFKKYLDHPDPTHRAFLKAGSSRVVLTIRPGFEDAFLAFINTGDMNDLPPSPYLEIGQEFRNYANTNYPGIPAANPVDNYRLLLYPKQKQAWEEMQLIMKLLEEYRERPKQRKARKEIRDIARMIMHYHREKGEYPPDLDALEEFIGNKIQRDDPWGNSYIYTCPGAHAEYDLLSYGADGEPGGEGASKDITVNTEFPEVEYPTTEQGLLHLKEYFAGVETFPIQDPWGNPYVFTCPGLHGDYDLASYGKDGEPGGDGEDADITSWAEASLIGQWFEYTPTSALDIGFDEEMPDK